MRRVLLKDVIFVMEQEKETTSSPAPRVVTLRIHEHLGAVSRRAYQGPARIYCHMVRFR